MLRQITLSLVFVALTACSSEEAVNEVEYQAGISYFDAPVQMAKTDDLVIKVHGVLGNDGCHSFSRAETIKTANLFELTLFGVRIEDPDIACTQALVEWNGKEFVKQPPHADLVTIIVHQPDGSTIEDTVATF